MSKYLTVSQYKCADDGLNLSNVQDRTIARYIARAETDIDTFMKFDLTRGGFEPHRIWLQSKFDEKTLKTQVPNYPAPVRLVTRYRIQVSNISTAGAGFFADINPGDCVINVTSGYVEIVPLQAVTYSLSPVLIQLGLRPPIIQMDSEVGFYLPAFADPLYPTNSSHTTYVALRGFWAQTYNQALATQPDQLPAIPPVIYVNGQQVSDGYTINYVEGSVTFTTPQPGKTITADYCYTIPDAVRDACLDQTTYLLGLRELNKLGVQGLGLLHNGDIEIRTTESFPPRFPTDTGALCDRAARRLSGYVPIPIA